MPIEYENGISVLDYATRYDEQTQTLEALIWWDLPDDKMLAEYNISLQIIDQDWQNRLQIDRHLDNNIVPWRVFALSTVDLPAGNHRLMLILYRRDTGARVSGKDPASGESEEILPLHSLSVGD